MREAFRLLARPESGPAVRQPGGGPDGSGWRRLEQDVSPYCLYVGSGQGGQGKGYVMGPSYTDLQAEMGAAGMV